MLENVRELFKLILKKCKIITNQEKFLIGFNFLPQTKVKLSRNGRNRETQFFIFSVKLEEKLRNFNLIKIFRMNKQLFLAQAVNF